ncbi:MAG: GTPase family protein [Hyphomicrobiaceae bacterium]
MDKRLKSWIGAAALAVAALVPLLALVPLGWVWLWQRGLALYWLGGALAFSVVVFGARMWLLRKLGKVAAQAAPDGAHDETAALKTPREQQAHALVKDLAGQADPARISSREELTALGIDVVEAVAHVMRPDERDPLWSFTVPEALLLVERVSQRLRLMVEDAVPFGHRLTVGQAMAVYEWRGVIDLGTKAYDLWRILRLANPLSAATQEIRERLSRSMYDGLRAEIAQRLASRFVEEVGEAAIDLYSGRLISLGQDSAPFAEESQPADGDDDKVVRILIAGRTGAGKSSLVNALAQEVRAVADVLPQTSEFTSYDVQRAGRAPVRLVDSPGVGDGKDGERLIEKVNVFDAVLWVVAGDRPDRDLDRKALDGITSWFNVHPERVQPPILIVATHVDRLRPFKDWSPPYDLADPQTAKSRTIRDALVQVAEDLAVPLDDIVPVCLSSERDAYNVDLVWARLLDMLPAAQSARLLRRVSETRESADWRRVLQQAAGAGRLIVGNLRRS